MDVVLLRTLTLKSPLRFGKFYDLTVNDILNSQGVKGSKYLTWVYYNCDMINFCDEILYILGITEKNEIKKPGKVDEVEAEKFYKKAIAQRVLKESLLPEEEIQLRKSMSKKQTYHNKRHRMIKSNKIVNRCSNKDILRYKNQGH